MVDVITVEGQYWDRVNEICITNGTLLLGFKPRHNRLDKTKCKLYCKCHGVYWETSNISNILSRRRTNCVDCTKELRTKAFLKDENIFLKDTIEACNRYNTEYLHWTKGYTGAFTTITHKCKLHGTITENTNARSLIRNINKTSGCCDCNKLTFSRIASTRESKHIKAFMKTGSYVDGTIFTKSERKTSLGVKNYWWVYCPRCNETNESFIGSLKKGSLPCSCGLGDYGYYPLRVEDPDQLYLLKLTPKYNCTPYYKIGRSFKTEVRVSNIKNPAACTVEIVARWYNLHQAVYDREQELHKICNSSHMVPYVLFKGCLNECFTEDCLSNPEVIKTFNL